MITFPVKTKYKEELIDITSHVRKAVLDSKVREGVCHVFVPHTTAAVTINENADPDVRSDILKGLSHLRFEDVRFDHSEGNSPAHLKSSMIGCSVTVLIENGDLYLGAWQGIFFCEFDGPRNRNVHVRVIEA